MADKENLENEIKENVETEKEEQKENKHKEMVPKQDYDELDDRYKRILAEFENFKKEVRKKEKDYIIQYLLM